MFHKLTHDQNCWYSDHDSQENMVAVMISNLTSGTENIEFSVTWHVSWCDSLVRDGEVEFFGGLGYTQKDQLDFVIQKIKLHPFSFTGPSYSIYSLEEKITFSHFKQSPMPLGKCTEGQMETLPFALPIACRIVLTSQSYIYICKQDI